MPSPCRATADPVWTSTIAYLSLCNMPIADLRALDAVSDAIDEGLLHAIHDPNHMLKRVMHSE